MFLQDAQNLIENGDRIISYGIIFADTIKVIEKQPTRIHQNIKFVNMENWTVYEHYKINEKNIMNELGVFNSTFQYVPKLLVTFEERRRNFQGYHLKASYV